MSWPPRREEDLNEFTMYILRDTDGEPTDTITPNNELWRRMRQKNSGMIERRPPGQGPVEDLLYATPSRSHHLSISHDLQPEEYTPIEVITQAKYEWVSKWSNLTIGRHEFNNSQGRNAFANLVQKKKKALEKGVQNELAATVWDGQTVGNEKVFGLKELIQQDPSSNPARGTIGGIDATAGNATFWRNQTKDFDGAYKTIESGRTRTALLSEDANSMLRLWMECSNNDAGNTEDGRPDLMPCNDVFYQQIANLAEEKLIFMNKEDKFQLGIDGFWFRSGPIFWDPLCPTLDSGKGNVYFLNTSAISWVFAEGLEKEWGEMAKVPGMTGFYWPMGTQYSIVCNDRRKLGVLYGVDEAQTIT